MKTLGGVRYTYAVKDGDAVRPSSVAPFEPAERQRAALDAVLETLDPKALVLPDRLLDLIPPQAFNRPEGTAERFTGKAGLVFDPVAAAVTAADFAVSGLLNPQRAARLADSHARDPRPPGLATSWSHSSRRPGTADRIDGPRGHVARAVQWLVVTRLIGLASDEAADPGSRAVASHASRVARSPDRNRQLARTGQLRLARTPTPGPSRWRSAGSSAAPTPPTNAPSPRRTRQATRLAAEADGSPRIFPCGPTSKPKSPSTVQTIVRHGFFLHCSK